MRTFISFEQALESVLRSCRVLEPEMIPLEDALGRVLATDIISRENIPPFASSAMDGYAVRHEDLECLRTQTTESGPPKSAITLRLIDELPAGTVSNVVITSGTCVKIMTGAPVPEGATAIVPRELVEESVGGSTKVLNAQNNANIDVRTVSFVYATDEGKHIRPAAEDVRIGDTVLSQGTEITPPVVGMLATLGFGTVAVVRKPVVRIISTGDEIVAPSSTPGPGQIRNSNGPGLRAQALMAGASCTAFEHAADSPEAIRDVILSGTPSDVMVFSGGVSVGDHDHVKAVLEELGMEMVFWKVRQRPGKPLAFGLLSGTLIFGLPGNPVSSAMCFEVYVRPLIQAMMGKTHTLADKTPEIRAVLDETIEKVPNLHYFARGICTQQASGTLRVSLTGPQGSNLYQSVVRANCIVHLPEGSDRVPSGEMVKITLLPWEALRPS